MEQGIRMKFKNAAVAAAFAAALLGAYALGQTASAQSSPPPRIVGYGAHGNGAATVLLQYSNGTFRHCINRRSFPDLAVQGRDQWLCADLSGIPAR